jgi:predicted kinase
VTGRLIVISGLPGVGKTSVAESAAARTGAVHLSIDAVEESILACGLPSAQCAEAPRVLPHHRASDRI